MRLHSSVPRSDLDSVIKEFTGEIFQRPPQRSSVSREVRSRTIYKLQIEESEGNLFVFSCLCQSGTYVRKLVYDMGEVLGVGGTMVELRRTRVGPLSEGDGLTTLHQLNDAMFRLRSGDESALRRVVKPIEDSLASLKRITIRDSAVDAICHGAKLGVPGVLSLSDGISEGDAVVLMSGKGELVALGKATLSSEQVARSKSGLASTTERVIMRQGTYPKLWKTKAKKSTASPATD
jgi:H/ACA ribonucleoprotein complex subunit 4